MSTRTRLLLCGMFCAPFLLLAATYRKLPSEMPVLRIWIGHVTLSASKSPFMVFRVSLMNLIHGLMAAVMLARASDFGTPARRVAYSSIFSTLLFALALKSDFEAAEFSLPQASWLGFGTLISVVGGIGLALFRSHGVQAPWTELRLSVRDKTVLAGLFATYIGIVILSVVESL